MSWKDKIFTFGIYQKSKQTLKYAKNQSCHQKMVFSAIPKGVFTRLGCLTSITAHRSLAQGRPPPSQSTYAAYVT
eukprot:10709041-Ditylum_brightwellii.AAC.1